MLVKFHSRGSGGGDSPVNYLLGEDRDREGATVLRGNAEITKELINSTDYARRYTSGVLSFEESHTEITDKTKARIMDEFEKTLFAGLESDQYNILWVEHTDKDDRLELNFLIPNQELRSGKRLQPFFHAADLLRVNAFQNVTNMSFKFSDPHDPANKRTHNPYFSRSANLKGIDKEDYTESQIKLTTHADAKSDLTDYIYNLASSARLQNRKAIETELKKQGFEVERVTKTFISVSTPKFAKNIRLDDPIFSENFNQYGYTSVGLHRKQQQYEQDKQNKILKDALEILTEGIKIKAEYHNERFKSADMPKPYDLGLDAPAQAQTRTDDLVKTASKDISSPSLDY
jgi:hypothetical protein